MEYRTQEQIEVRARQTAPVSDQDIDRLAELLSGVRTAADLMERLIQPFDGHVDVTKMSGTVEGPEP